jgi:hypothetical protein
MPVATLTIELAIEHAQSLKDRRQAVRSLKDKLRHGFNISVAQAPPPIFPASFARSKRQSAASPPALAARSSTPTSKVTCL